jgi:hypothetical protein
VTGPAGDPADPPDLEVLVSAGCASCAHAIRLAQQVRTTHPHLLVRVVDVDEPGWVPPPGFVGTPMFVVAGRVLSLGNPSVEALHAALPGRSR